MSTAVEQYKEKGPTTAGPEEEEYELSEREKYLLLLNAKNRERLRLHPEEIVEIPELDAFSEQIENELRRLQKTPKGRAAARYLESMGY